MWLPWTVLTVNQWIFTFFLQPVLHLRVRSWGGWENWFLGRSDQAKQNLWHKIVSLNWTCGSWLQSSLPHFVGCNGNTPVSLPKQSNTLNQSMKLGKKLLYYLSWNDKTQVTKQFVDVTTLDFKTYILIFFANIWKWKHAHPDNPPKVCIVNICTKYECMYVLFCINIVVLMALLHL